MMKLGLTFKKAGMHCQNFYTRT